MSKTNLHKYIPSGRFQFSLLFYLLLMALVTLGFCYLIERLLIAFSDFYISVPVFLIRVYLLGLFTIFLIRKGKVRHTVIGFVCGFVLGLISWSSSWFFLLSEMRNTPTELTLLENLNNVPMLFEKIPLMVEAGRYQIMGYSLRGYTIEAVWLVEMLVLLVYPAFKGFEATRNRLFCESCTQWAEDQGGMLAFYFSDEEGLSKQFESGDFTFMDKAQAIFNVPMHDYYQINSQVCIACNDQFSLSLVLMKKATDLDKPKPRVLLEQLLVKRPYYQHLSTLKSQFPVPEER